VIDRTRNSLRRPQNLRHGLERVTVTHDGVRFAEGLCSPSDSRPRHLNCGDQLIATAHDRLPRGHDHDDVIVFR
jgi:hypothetical protein